MARQIQVRLDSRQIKELAAAYRDGQTMKELAERFGIHRTTVTAILQRQGPEPRHRGLSGDQVVEACRLYPEGWPLARLAEKYGVDDMTVQRYLLDVGVVMRSPH